MNQRALIGSESTQFWGACWSGGWYGTVYLVCNDLLRSFARHSETMAQPVESTLEMARRHVREGEGRVARLETIVADLERKGYADSAALGRTALETVRTSLREMKRHLRGIEAKAKP